MTALEKLQAEAATLVKRQEEARAKAHATQAKIQKETYRLAKVRQAKLGALADAAGLTALTLETWQIVCEYVASIGTTDAHVLAWVDAMTEESAIVAAMDQQGTRKEVA